MHLPRAANFTQAVQGTFVRSISFCSASSGFSQVSSQNGFDGTLVQTLMEKRYHMQYVGFSRSLPD